MEALQDVVNEAIRERKGEIINEASDIELIRELESRGYNISPKSEKDVER